MKKSLLLASLYAVYTCFQHATKKVPLEEQAGLRKVTPPEFLYVRVTESRLSTIYRNGLGGENRVWLWCNVSRAWGDCPRSGYKMLTIETGAMHEAGYEFWLASDGSYTTREIPAQYIE